MSTQPDHNPTKIEVGHVVILKSGGPKMTVTKIKEGADCVECSWFDGKVITAAILHQHSLIKLKPGINDPSIHFYP